MQTGTTVRTTCPYCGVGCGVLATPQADGTATIAGDPDHPANFGRLCSKGSALGETLSLDERLLHPEIRGRRTDWDEALNLVASTFSRTIAEYGPDSVAIYGSGQLLTEDYYVANKLMKGFIGSGNMDTNSRLCMASSVAGHVRAFGSDTVPGNYEDLELADLIVLVGSNLAWCHPVLYQRILAAKAQRPQMRLVLIDPRRTATADAADLHLAIRSDGDVALFTGLLSFLAAAGAINTSFVADHTTGADEALDLAAGWTPAHVAESVGLSEIDVSTFYRWFAATPKVVTVFSQGVNQSASGTDKVNAIINCHLLTGRIGRPGMGPFSVTGQPNAMGGREVGGLAQISAAHMDFSPVAIDRLRRFWHSERVAMRPGRKAVDLFSAVATGEIKAIWIMATNPVDSMPQADAVRAALAQCPFVVISDMSSRTDTGRIAHVRLPAASWGEKDGTVTNSERRISRQRAFLPLPGQARPDWWIVSQVAQCMGFAEAFAFDAPASIFAEHVALSAFENGGTRDFDLSGLSGADYDTLEPVQWPVRDGGTARLFGDGRFFSADGRARLIAVEPPPVLPLPPGRLTLNTGRVRDHWHTMTRTGKTARLSAHFAEPFVEIHPRDAERLGIHRASLVRVASAQGEVTLRALVTDRQKAGHLFAPMHWTDQFASNARIDALMSGKVDPISAQPALKALHILAQPFPARMYGFMVSSVRITPNSDYWAIAPAPGGQRSELAWLAEPDDWEAWLRAAIDIPPDAHVQTMFDRASGRRAFAALVEGRLLAALYLSPDPVLVARQWAVGLLAETELEPITVLAGRPGADAPDTGAIVCSCFGIGINTITAAIRDGCTSVEAVGACTKAGTNCGSCRPEIRTLLAATQSVPAE